MLKPSVRTKIEDGILIADFWDCLRLDPAPVKDLRSRYERHVEDGGQPDLIVDFNGVSFAGSAALSGLVTLQRQCRKRGGRVVLCEVEPSVLEAFRISRLDPMFTFTEDLGEATRLLQNGKK